MTAELVYEDGGVSTQLFEIMIDRKLEGNLSSMEYTTEEFFDNIQGFENVRPYTEGCDAGSCANPDNNLYIADAVILGSASSGFEGQLIHYPVVIEITVEGSVEILTTCRVITTNSTSNNTND